MLDIIRKYRLFLNDPQKELLLYEISYSYSKQAQSDLWAATIYKLMHPNENYTNRATNVWLLAWECFYVCKGNWGVCVCALCVWACGVCVRVGCVCGERVCVRVWWVFACVCVWWVCVCVWGVRACCVCVRVVCVCACGVCVRVACVCAWCVCSACAWFIHLPYSTHVLRLSPYNSKFKTRKLHKNFKKMKNLQR